MSHSFPSTTQDETLVELLRWRAGHQPGQRAFTFLTDGETEAVDLTYGELDWKARTIAARLQQKNAAGRPILLLYPPGLDFIAALFGCFYAGAIAVPAYPPQLDRNSARLAAMIADTQAKVFLTTTSTLTQIQRRMAEIPNLKELLWLTTDTWPVEMADTWAELKPKADTLAFLQYTSGSTAVPKGVMITHGNIIQNLGRVIQTSGLLLGDQREGVSWLPPYHDLGLTGMIYLAIYTGRPFTLMPPVAFMQKPVRWLQAISRTRATYSAGPNFAYDLCVDKITPGQRAELDLSSWAMAVIGAEPIRHTTLERFATAFAPCGFRKEALYPAYGGAEATLVISGGMLSEPPVTCTVQKQALKNNQVIADNQVIVDNQMIAASTEEPGSHTLVGCGRALDEHNMIIVDPQILAPCASDQVGEIWVSGPSVARGYWNQPEETQRTFQAYLADGDGPFLRTGDLGFLKGEELFITGRCKDLIIIRGYNYYPQDIELAAEGSHPALRFNSGAAFSVDVDDQEQLVIVFELERRHRKADVEEVAGAIRAAIARNYGIETYAVVLIKTGHLPKTSSGKIRRSQCRQQFLENTLPVMGMSIKGQADDLPGPKISIEQTMPDMMAQDLQQQLELTVRMQLAQLLQVAPTEIDFQRSIQSLGLGSLHATAVKYQLESDFGVEVSPEIFFEDITLDQFISRITHLAGSNQPKVENVLLSQ